MSRQPDRKNLRCPSCGTEVEVLEYVVSATCDGGGKHKQMRMEEVVCAGVSRRLGDDDD